MGRTDSVQANYENIDKIHSYSLFEMPPRPPLKNVALHKKETQSSISEIRVFNRVEHEELVRRANRIAIDIDGSEDGYREICLYGSDGKPLIFRPSEPILGRFVRIRLPTKNWLHFEQV
ncbi:MAG TPA: hypothetical protein VLT37_02970 [Acidocella sp.]|nr:hypothetical protein [Acidocella sp.]